MSDLEDRLADLAAIRKGLVIGAVSYDGDSWFAANAGYGYDEAQADLNRAFAVLDQMAATLADAPDDGLRAALLHIYDLSMNEGEGARMNIRSIARVALDGTPR